MFDVFNLGKKRTFPLRIPATTFSSFDALEHSSRNRGHGTVRVWRMPRSSKSQWTENVYLRPLKLTRFVASQSHLKPVCFFHAGTRKEGELRT